jgi:hypothetical protein
MLEALVITEETYDTYLQMPTRENEDHLDFEAAKNHFIIMDTHDRHGRSNWTCVSFTHFSETYKFIFDVDTFDPTKFAPITYK